MADDALRPDQPDSPFLMERLMRYALLEEAAEYDSEAAFRDAVTAQADDGILQRRHAALEGNPRELAQELAYQAYEAEEGEAALELVDKALALDDHCVDALCVRAFLTCEDVGALITELEHAATTGENRLGEEFFAEFMGDFWPMVEARPYLRTIKQLAEVLWSAGRRLDAIAHYENLMDLDPADHMGNAQLLVGYYLAMGEVQRSWDLLEEVDDDESPVFAWSWVLLLLLVGDEEAARDSLNHAMETNPYVAPMLIGVGEDEPQEDAAGWAQSGSEGEARIVVEILGEAWECAVDAQWWLYDLLVDLGLVAPSDGEMPAPEGPAN